MTLQENFTNEEHLMLNILIDEDIQSESSGESHCSQKRKAVDPVDGGNSKQRKRVGTYILCVSHY
jgi:hypothetical protein